MVLNLVETRVALLDGSPGLQRLCVPIDGDLHLWWDALEFHARDSLVGKHRYGDHSFGPGYDAEDLWRSQPIPGPSPWVPPDGETSFPARPVPAGPLAALLP